MKSVIEFLKEESGATAIEYGLLAALISISCIAAMTSVGDNLTAKLDEAATAMS